MNNKLKMILLSTQTLMLTGCPMIDSESVNIKIINRSDKEISFQPNEFAYPFSKKDTLLQNHIPVCGIKAKGYCLYSATTNSDWRRELYGGRILQILVIEDGDQLLKYWPSHEDTLRRYVPVVQRYHLTIKDLERLHWIVSYPPTEDMEDINMWPPYKK